MPSESISSKVPDLCCLYNLSPPGVSSISIIWPDSDSCTWLKGYCPVDVPVVSTPLGCGSSKVVLVSSDVNCVDVPSRFGLIAIGTLVTIVVLRFFNDLLFCWRS